MVCTSFAKLNLLSLVILCLQSNEVHKDDFLRVIRNIVGDQMLKQAAHKVFAQVSL
jgi:hypothetical protein